MDRSIIEQWRRAHVRRQRHDCPNSTLPEQLDRKFTMAVGLGVGAAAALWLGVPVLVVTGMQLAWAVDALAWCAARRRRRANTWLRCGCHVCLGDRVRRWWDSSDIVLDELLAGVTRRHGRRSDRGGQVLAWVPLPDGLYSRTWKPGMTWPYHETLAMVLHDCTGGRPFRTTEAAVDALRRALDGPGGIEVHSTGIHDDTVLDLAERLAGTLGVERAVAAATAATV